ncbi:MAG: c-type cytochrome [Acidobacteria bacterium]|nr:c-type cytochrome [Acidobacteriota bacterium]
MKRTIKIVLLTLFGVGYVLAQSSGQEKPAEQVYNNIQVFKGLPASQLQTVMTFMAGSLGVKCSHCHAGPFEKDDKPEKQTARRMIRMVFDINRGNFSGMNAVTCYTCHRGQPTPSTVPSLGQSLWQSAGAADAKAVTNLPTVDQVLDKYVEAIGGKSSLMKLRSRIVKGVRVGADGVVVPEEVYQKAPNKLLIVTRYPELVLRKGFDGARGWARDAKGATILSEQDLAELERDADFYKDINLKRLYGPMNVKGKEKIGEQQAYVVEAKSNKGSSERLYFDVQNGLLIRRYKEFKIAIGSFPTQTEYEDYQEIDGIKLPFTLRWSIPGRTWGRKITEVKHNTAIDEAIFSPIGLKN